MDANTITIYRAPGTLRVVKGDHKPHADSRKHRITVYPSAELAYATEKDQDTRAAILRIDPTANTGAKSKFVATPPTYRRLMEVEKAMGVGCTCPTEMLLESRFSDDCPIHGKGTH